jgi:hypothetical protein
VSRLILFDKRDTGLSDHAEQPGDHSLRFAGSGDNDALFREIAEFLATAG